MPGLRDIKRRIKSIQSTRKITRAMQMVSAAKMRRAQEATLASRTYSSLAWELILNLSESEQIAAPLLKTHPKAGRIALAIMTTNRGQVGSLNANLLATVERATAATGLPTDFVCYGNKGKDYVVRGKKQILADFQKFDRQITMPEIYPLADFLTKLYLTGRYRQVLLAYNHFQSTLVQKPMVRQLLPFARSILQATHAKKNRESLDYQPSRYEFEPAPKTVMRKLLPRIVESQIYQTILENEASEQSARMVMMKNATEAAGDLISDLTLTYNKLRQNKITTELAEITAGKIALE